MYAVGPNCAACVIVKTTSSALNGWPSEHLTPWRRWKVNVLASGDASQLSARSGTIVFSSGATLTRLDRISEFVIASLPVFWLVGPNVGGLSLRRVEGSFLFPPPPLS